MDNNTPPLKIWVWVGISFLIFQIFIITRSDFSLRNEDNRMKNMFRELYQQLENDFQQADSSTIKVAIIGSSLVGHGILCSDEIDNYVKKKQDQDIIKYWEDKKRYSVSPNTSITNNEKGVN